MKGKRQRASEEYREKGITEPNKKKTKTRKQKQRKPKPKQSKSNKFKYFILFIIQK